MSSIEKQDYYENPYTVVEAINTLPAFAKQKAALAELDEGSPEYFRTLLKGFPLKKNPDMPSFGVAVPDSKESDEYSAIFRNGELNKRLCTSLHSSLSTGYDLFQMAVKMHPDNDCLGVRLPIGEDVYADEFSWYKYSEVNTMVHEFGAGLLNVVNLKRNQPLNTNDFIVSMWSPNRREWTLADLGCQAFSLGNTALYDTLGPNTSTYILNKTECPVVVCSKDKIIRVLGMLNAVPTLNTIISMDELTEDELHYLNGLVPQETNARGERISVMSMKQVMKVGRLSPVAPIPPKPTTLYTISFTSGTTGLPKGVSLTHLQYVCSITFGLTNGELPELYDANQLYYLSLLPLAHIFERGTLGFNLMYGAGIGFLHKPVPEALIDDMKVLKPHLFCGVPRIFTKFEAGLKSALLGATGLKKKLVDSILASRANTLGQTELRDDSFTTKLQRKLLIDKARAGLGLERCGLFITGSAPISPDTIRFLRSVLDVGIRQGYGLTESFSGMCCSDAFESSPGNCGVPGITCEVRVRSIPSMNYHAKDNKGELLLRGPHIFEGYFKNPEETKKCLDSDGWFATGDVARIDEQGRIYIIDRVKNFFKLAQGEYIAPEKIENTYLSCCPLLTQLFVHGDSLQTYLVAIAGIDIPTVKQLLQERHPEIQHYSDKHVIKLVNTDAETKHNLLERMNKAVVSSGLQGFEKIHNIRFDIEPLKVTDETVTPTMKIKRANCSKFFASQLSELYGEGSLVKAGRL